LGIPPEQQRQKMFVAENVKFLKKEFFAKVKWEGNRTLIGLLNLRAGKCPGGGQNAHGCRTSKVVVT
jgi:hypothetical protein